MTPRLHQICLSSVVLLVSAQAMAAGSDHVVRVAYRDGDVVSIRGHMGYALDVQLQEGEHVVNIAAGNLSAIDIGVEAAHVFVKPKRAVEGMNIIVLTDRHTYRLDYRTDQDHAPGQEDIVFAVVFDYPLATPTPKPVPAVDTWNTNYWFCGDSEVRPSEAFDDGARTYLRFSPGTEFPAAYLIESDGKERLVNTHAAGDWIVVHQTVRRLALRRGSLAGCVENRGAPAGRPPPRSGDRQRKESSQ